MTLPDNSPLGLWKIFWFVRGRGDFCFGLVLKQKNCVTADSAANGLSRVVFSPVA